MGSPTEVLVLEYIGGEEGRSAIQCQNLHRGECSFHGANSQACSTHGNRHIECVELLHNCKCASPTLTAPLPDILCYLPSTLGRACQAGEEPRTCSAAMQTPEAVTERWRGVEENHSVMTPPMVGSTWPRVRSTLESDCLPTLSQGTASFHLAVD